MATCPSCGGSIQFGVGPDGSKVPLEWFTETSGQGRYLIIGHVPLTVTPVAEDSPVRGFPDHRLECPDYGNGLSWK